MSKLKFGVIYNARTPFDTLKAVQLADSEGVWLAGTYDSHFLWQEPWVHYAAWAVNTKSIHIGPFVTNPLTRHITVTASAAATLAVFSGNRAFVGLGRGDSAVRTMQKKPADLSTLESSVKIIGKLSAGETAKVDGADVKIPWASRRVPVYVAAYGPKALQLAGKVGDGVILQIADAEVIEWSLKWVRKGAESVGRSLDNFEVISAAAWCLDEELGHARSEVRWFPAMVSNHAVDLLSKYPKEELPPSLIGGMEDRGSYDYWEHARKDAHHLGFVTDDMIDRFSIIGDSKSAIERLDELKRVGVTTAVAYLLGDDFHLQTKRMTQKIVPHY